MSGIKRIALLVGINDYNWVGGQLQGCINDAKNMEKMLSDHHDGAPNFHCKRLTSDETRIDQKKLRKSIEELFSREMDIVLFYFSGHGTEKNLDGYLVTQDAEKYKEGVSVSEIINLANSSDKVKEILIVLDCCHSGHLGNIPNMKGEPALLRKGVSILTASLPNEYAVERDGQGLFTKTILEGFSGGAADTLGNVTAASLYNYVDKMLGPWEQRPVFKSHVTEMTNLRECAPKVSKENIRKLTDYFPDADYNYPLDKSYESTAQPENEEKEAIFNILQKFTAAGLVQPNGEEHMYFAAMNEKSCSLTALGKFYWQQEKNRKI